MMKVRLFDVNGKPVMDAGIAVKGKYISGYTEKKSVKEPVLKEYYAIDEFTTGDFVFGVWGLPDTITLSATAPGFYKYVGTAERQVGVDGYVSYRVMDANSPYNTSDVRVKKQGDWIYVDAFLLQLPRGRYGGR